jgi:hypothetical protein
MVITFSVPLHISGVSKPKEEERTMNNNTGFHFDRDARRHFGAVAAGLLISVVPVYR